MVRGEKGLSYKAPSDLHGSLRVPGANLDSSGSPRLARAVIGGAPVRDGLFIGVATPLGFGAASRVAPRAYT